MVPVESLPSFDAFFNALSAILMTTGYFFIRRRNIIAHRACMLGAVASSLLFLVGYLTYHAQAGTTRFQGTGLIRPIYFAVLISHTILAAAIVPLVIITLSRALRGKFSAHKKIARFTLPIWLYVSVTGVLVYFALYHWFAKA
ncbi:MAG TPA: DUF420 domain-containing protein [Fimbriimonadales bacterium]|jgi:uncharacterized membrane protein YozB (DUF420 family)|nr:DUF420 domain-containing protein [Fimbriimonadales bacterium]